MRGESTIVSVLGSCFALEAPTRNESYCGHNRLNTQIPNGVLQKDEEGCRMGVVYRLMVCSLALQKNLANLCTASLKKPKLMNPLLSIVLPTTSSNSQSGSLNDRLTEIQWPVERGFHIHVHVLETKQSIIWNWTENNILFWLLCYSKVFFLHLF